MFRRAGNSKASSSGLGGLRLWSLVFIGSLLAADVAVVAPRVAVATPVVIGTRPDIAGGEERPVPGLPSGQSLVATPGAVPTAVVPKGFDVDKSVELTAGRDVFQTLFANPDGSETLMIAAAPVHFKAQAVWERIDPTLVRSENGSWSNRANSWTVSFPSDLSGAVGFSDAQGSFGWRPVGAAQVAGRVEEDGVSIRYA